VQFAAGHVVGSSGAYNVGDTSGCAFLAFGEGFLCAGLIDAQEADVHLVVRTHGPALPAFFPEQFGSFDGACTRARWVWATVQTPALDMQFAVHETG
jgi:hypothetical protein